MVDLVDIQSVYYMVAATGVLVAAAYYIIALRSSGKTRQAQLFMQVYNMINSREMCEADYDLMHLDLKDIADWNELLKDKEKYVSWTQWGNLHEGMGVLVRENLVDIRLVAQLLSGPIIWYWEKYEPFIMEFRKELNFPRAMIEMEYLYNRLMKYATEHPDLQIKPPKLP
jgi:hypothetical protein